MRRTSIMILMVSGLFAIIGAALAAERTGLPFDLEYFMTKPEVVNHLKAFAMYRVNTEKEDEIAFVVPDPGTNTKNGMFLEFERGKLVEITSIKSGMKKAQFETYLKQMLSIADKWKKTSGASTVFESTTNNFYLYKDERSYMTISGGGPSESFSVDVSFTEKEYHERRYGKAKKQ